MASWNLFTMFINVTAVFKYNFSLRLTTLREPLRMMPRAPWPGAACDGGTMRLRDSEEKAICSRCLGASCSVEVKSVWQGDSRLNG